MKQPKKLTRQQKMLLDAKGFDPRNFFLQEETPLRMIFINPATGQTVTIRADGRLEASTFAGKERIR